MSTRERTDRETIARLTREVKALTEERAHLRRLAHAYRTAREAADLNHPADVTKAFAASYQAHAIAEEVMAKLTDGSDA